MTDDNTFDNDETKSKTQIKKEALALQNIGEQLTRLNNEQLAQIPLGEELKKVVLEVRKIKSNSAKKRQIQYLGKLLRKTDSEAIVAAYQHLQQDQHRLARQHHLIEKWRDNLLSDDGSQLNAFLQEFPHTDRQQLRQLIRGARLERDQQKPPAQARKLFRLIRETIAASQQNSGWE